jgi:hypothetical protein
MKSLLLFMLCAVYCVGEVVSIGGNSPNSFMFWNDSCRIDSTETKYLRVLANDAYANKTLLIEARDDSSAGFASDSACVKIEIVQVWPINRGNIEYFVELNSRAHPDSSYPGGSDYVLFDSLDILSMDTVCVYKRNRVTITNPSGNSSYAGDSLKTLQTSGFGAFVYTCLPPDASPAGVFKFTGTSKNEKRGAGSFWRIRGYQIKAMVTK